MGRPAIDVFREVSDAFARRGGELYGERVSQLDHALQCAALAKDDGAPEALIAAALLHDIGHILDGAGEAAEARGEDARHEAIGARWLSRRLCREVAAPVALHVAAKRYLCVVEVGYAERLSEASQLSLRLQGGPFTPEEAARFAAAPFATEAVRLRRWDDEAKVEDWRGPPLEAYRDLLERLAVA